LGDRQQVAAGGGAAIEFYLRKTTCWRPEVKGLNVMVNSSYNGWRFEDVWLDK
jgi:peptide/nickel transport system substrate-binding protein